MSNKKLILGIAAGAAALAVVAVVLKRKGYLDGVIEKAEGFGEELADKYQSVKDQVLTGKDELVELKDRVVDQVKSNVDSIKDKIKGVSDDANDAVQEA